jgi:XRE family transcriptional regulator, regulator of sulfur utilization
MTSSDIDIGANIRAFRQKKKLSLNELSRLTSISASNLSSMELGKSSPTLSTLTKIAAAFDMKPGAFLDEVLYHKAVLCRKSDFTDKLTETDDFSMGVLTANVHANRMESSILVLKPRGKPLRAWGEGADRFLYCLRGEVTASVGDEFYVLGEEDSLYLLPEATTELRNPGATDASLLIVRLKSRRGGW